MKRLKHALTTLALTGLCGMAAANEIVISQVAPLTGVLASTGLSSPRKVTWRASALTPACCSTVFSATPRQRALPIEPLPSCAPNTRGIEKPRLLPEH